MQVKIHKVLFAGTKNTQDKFFERAQQLGFIEFISLLGKNPHLFPADVCEAKEALKILSAHNQKSQEEQCPGSITTIINDIVSTKEKSNIAFERKRNLEMELVRLKPFGKFCLQDLHALEEESQGVVQFFMIRHDRVLNMQIPDSLLFINNESNMDYFLYFGKEKFEHAAFTEVIIERSYNEAFAEYQDLVTAIDQMREAEIEATCYVKMIEEYIFARMNSINLNFAKEDVEYFLEDKLFAIEAWIPENKIEKISDLTQGLAIISQKVARAKDEEPPTHLENKGFARMGEDLVYVYDTPSATDKDPSPWVIWFFALFFGMIISDAAYGLLFLSAAVFCWAKFGKTLKGTKRRALKIFTLISCSTILWGVMVASYFSVKMKPNDFLNTISLPYNLALKKIEYHQERSTELYKEWVHEYPAIENVNIPSDILLKGTKNKDNQTIFELMNETYDGIFLEISLIVGIIHLSLSLMRNLRRNWGGIGWIGTLFGGYLFFQKVLNGTSMVVYTGLIDKDLSIVIGEQMLYGGVGLAVVCGILQARGLSGITVIFKAIEIFSDVLSYLRLYALGLASVVLAGTFNEIGPAIGGQMFGWIIVLLGHIVNISLGVMAGVIHGLRLNFLEWYHHSYEGGGKKFSPLRLLKNE